MPSLLRTELGRFRVVSLLEGLSYLVLLGYAMPLKYVWGDPTLVRMVGRLHGGLFVLFVVALARAVGERGWDTPKTARAFGFSLVPFGAFVLERELKEEMGRSERDVLPGSKDQALTSG
jgi:integral membrane protein